MFKTDLWVRNPHNYIRECLATGVRQIVWDYGTTLNKAIDPYGFGKLWFPPGEEWRAITVHRDGATEVGPNNSWYRPIGVYPVWNYGEDFDLLTDYLEHGPEIMRERPHPHRGVAGQEHRVVIAQTPKADIGLVERFLLLLAELQREHPDCKIHLHGFYTPQWIVGGLFHSADFEARHMAANYQVRLPTGEVIHVDNAGSTPGYRKWVRLLGYSPGQIQKEARFRCEFNIRSHYWMAENWMEDTTETVPVARQPPLTADDFKDLLTGETPEPVAVKIPRVKKLKLGTSIGDRFYCDACSFATTCRVYRKGSICAVPDSEADELARHFQTRNSEVIIQGLGKLMEGQVERLVDGRKQEKATGELDPHVTRIADNLFKQGTQLAKLVDPGLRSAAVAVNIASAGDTAIGVGGMPETSNEIASRIVGQLEAKGVPRDEIDAELVRRVIETGDLEGVVRELSGTKALPQFIDVQEHDSD